MKSDMRQFIEHLPKAELHMHIEGSLEPELKFRLAERNGLELPYEDVSAMRRAYQFDDLPSFLAVYYEGMSVLLEEEDFYDLTLAYLRKAASQNVVYAEFFFDPQAHTSRGVGFETVISGIHRAQVDGEREYGIRTNLIMCFLRDMTVQSATETLEAALPYKDLILGVGLDSDERNNPPLKFREVFERAGSEGFLLTMHCDVDQQDSVPHLWQCLNEINVNRIDHGVNSLEDERLCDEIKARDLGLTVCPISNGYVAGGLKSAEITAMLERGMKVTVNSDDPAYFPGYMNENLTAVQEEAALSKDQLLQLVRNGFSASWLSAEEKERYLRRVAED